MMFYHTYDEIMLSAKGHRSLSRRRTPHSDKVHELFERCMYGEDKVYAKVLEQAETEHSQESSAGIYISLITENMLRYDERIFTGAADENNRAYQLEEGFYRPYIFEFAVDMEGISQGAYARLTDTDMMGTWFEASFSGQYADNTGERIEVPGIVMTSASPFKFVGMRIIINVSHVANHITRWTKRLYHTAGAVRTGAQISRLLSGFFSAGDYHLFVYNVGDGNCIYIKGGDGKRVLYDIGHNYNPGSQDWEDPDIRRSERAIRRFRPHGVILSHWDMDHLAGVVFTDDSLYTKDWIAPDPNVLPDSQFSVNSARIAKYLESRNILNLVDSGARNQRIFHGAGVSVWNGQGKVCGRRLTEANNAGLIIEFEKKVRTSGGRVSKRTLLTGDCEYLAFPAAMGFSAKTYEVLLVPHHGSRMDASAVAATGMGAAAIISVSPRNTKRPDAVHMDSLKARNYQCCFTQSCCIEIPSVWSPGYFIR